MGLSKAQVVEAAIRQIDEKGFAGFSLRELARTLKVSPTVIYWHVGGAKEDLFAEIAASITGALSEGLGEEPDWKTRLRAVFLRYRKLVHEHPNVAPLLGAQMKSNGVANIDWVETVLSALQDAGYKGDDLRTAFNALLGGLVGFVTMELAPPPSDKATDWEQLFAERVAQIDPQTHPLTHAALPHITNRIFVLRWQNGADISYDDGFTLLLDLLIEGLAARAPR
ncbi:MULTISPECIES: TetR/AcrR family transcriptional regulator [Pseudooceanicola]|uniref:TetR/AcrR family transcriptional regulator n=1 Tax=Pseudooceanicola TaxID=1679449 RepID=UPI00288005ED|nr:MULTISPECIES: TetR/AcrR family transcriptional regulator [Pseudooceanicola]